MAGLNLIIGYFFSTPSEQEIVVDSVMSILPVSKEYLSSVVSDTLSRRGTLGLLGTVGLLWTGASMFAAMRKSVAHVWRIAKPQNIFIQRGTDLLMIVTLGFILFWRVLVNIEPLNSNSKEFKGLIKIRAYMDDTGFDDVAEGLLVLKFRNLGKKRTLLIHPDKRFKLWVDSKLRHYYKQDIVY